MPQICICCALVPCCCWCCQPGHRSEGYGLAWSHLRAGHLLSGSDDSLVCTWDINSTTMDGRVSGTTGPGGRGIIACFVVPCKGGAGAGRNKAEPAQQQQHSVMHTRAGRYGVTGRPGGQVFPAVISDTTTMDGPESCWWEGCGARGRVGRDAGGAHLPKSKPWPIMQI